MLYMSIYIQPCDLTLLNKVLLKIYPIFLIYIYIYISGSFSISREKGQKVIVCINSGTNKRGKRNMGIKVAVSLNFFSEWITNDL